MEGVVRRLARPNDMSTPLPGMARQQTRTNPRTAAPLPPETVGKPDGVAVLVGKLEVGCKVAGLDHDPQRMRTAVADHRRLLSASASSAVV